MNNAGFRAGASFLVAAAWRPAAPLRMLRLAAHTCREGVFRSNHMFKPKTHTLGLKSLSTMCSRHACSAEIAWRHIGAAQQCAGRWLQRSQLLAVHPAGK